MEEGTREGARGGESKSERAEPASPSDMGYLPFVLLWGLPQIWENSEGEWSQGARAGAGMGRRRALAAVG